MTQEHLGRHLITLFLNTLIPTYSPMASTPVPPVEIWHEHHNYPTGDLVLVSNDGVKFRTFKGLIVRSR